MTSPSTPSGVRLELDTVTSGYGDVSVVRDVSCAVRPGEILALMGKNGMGKTTLLKTILGLIRATGGSIRFDGDEITGADPKDLIDLGVRYAPQDQPLFQDLTILDNFRLALSSDRLIKAGLDQVTRHFPFLGERLKQKAGTLSGGEQKMLIIARAMMSGPKLLLIDEISEGLQPTIVAKIAAALRAERDDNGTAILIVEQNLDFALSIADRWAIMKLGTLVDDGTVEPETREQVQDHFRI